MVMQSRNFSQVIRSRCSMKASVGHGVMPGGTDASAMFEPIRSKDPSGSHLSALTADGVPFGNVGILLGERIGEHMAAGAICDEVKRLGLGRMKHGLDAGL